MKIKEISFSKWINGIAVIVILFILNACFSSFQGTESTLTINLGRSNNRSTIPWPPEDPDILEDIIYIITLRGNNETKIFNAQGRGSITTTVSTGFWNVEVAAYYKATSFLYGAGSDRVQVRVGQNNTTTIGMERKYFKIGETGPGGGIIFYVADGKEGRDFGFTLANTGETVHYLEAAPRSALSFDPSDAWRLITPPPIPPFAADPPLTLERGIGTGKKNTESLIAWAQTNESGVTESPAADYCVNFSISGYENVNDWFLPSIDELRLIYENLQEALVHEYPVEPQGRIHSSSWYTSGSEWGSEVIQFAALYPPAGDHILSYFNDMDRVIPVRAF